MKSIIISFGNTWHGKSNKHTQHHVVICRSHLKPSTEHHSLKFLSKIYHLGSGDGTLGSRDGTLGSRDGALGSRDGTLVSPLLKNQHFQIPIWSWNALAFLNKFLWTPSCSRGKQITLQLHYLYVWLIIVILYTLDVAFRFRQQKFLVAEGFQLLKSALTAQ